MTEKYPQRLMSMFDLDYELRALERFGVQVPVLSLSNNTPRYAGTTEDGVERYFHDTGLLEVGPGQVIDSHGNVVDLHALRSRITIPLIKDKEGGFYPTIYRDVVIKNLNEGCRRKMYKDDEPRFKGLDGGFYESVQDRELADKELLRRVFSPTTSGKLNEDLSIVIRPREKIK